MCYQPESTSSYDRILGGRWKTAIGTAHPDSRRLRARSQKSKWKATQERGSLDCQSQSKLMKDLTVPKGRSLVACQRALS